MNNEYIKLYKFIEENEEIKSYIDKLLKTIEIKNQNNNKDKLDKLQELGAEYVEETDHIDGLMDKIEELGLEFDETDFVYLDGYNAEYEEDSSKALRKYGHYSFFHNNEYCCYHDMEWLNEDRVGYPIGMNGYSLTKEVLEDEKNNHTSKKKYEKWLEENSELETELENLKKQVHEDIELLDKKLFGKSKIKERLVLNQEKLTKLKDKQKQGDYLKRNSDFFEGLDEEKISLIEEYLNSIDKLNNTSIEIRENFYGLKHSCEKEMLSDVDSLIDEAIHYGLVTPEEVEKYDYILTNIDLANIIVSNSYIKNLQIRVDNYGQSNEQKLIDKYCQRISKLKMKKDFEELSEVADAKVKKITK